MTSLHGRRPPGRRRAAALRRSSAVGPHPFKGGGTDGLNLRADFGDLKLDEQVASVLAEWQSGLPTGIVLASCEFGHPVQIMLHYSHRAVLRALAA